MPLIQWSTGTPEEVKARKEKIKKILPKRRLTNFYLQPRLMKAMRIPLLKALKRELEIYREYPKAGKYRPKEFNPTNNIDCFMGQGFQANTHGIEGWTDVDLREYRKTVGTIDHREWGDVTLLEIWAADHFDKYGEMVLNAFMYGWKAIDKLPELKFVINPFYKNPQSGTFKPKEEQKTDQEYAQYLVMVADYCHVRDQMKKQRVKRPLDLDWRKTIETR